MKNNNNKIDEYQGKPKDSENEMIFLHFNATVHAVATPFQSCVDDRHIPFRATDGKFYAVDFFVQVNLKTRNCVSFSRRNFPKGFVTPNE